MLISVAVGVVLAVVYHVLSMRLQVWLAQRNSSLVPFVTILGFLARVTVVALTLVALGLWTRLNIIGLCIAFVAVFTILNGFSLYTLMAKRHGAPPSAGASGVQ